MTDKTTRIIKLKFDSGDERVDEERYNACLAAIDEVVERFGLEIK